MTPLPYIGFNVESIEHIHVSGKVYDKCSTTLARGTPNPGQSRGKESALHVLLAARIRYAVMESGLDAGLVYAAERAAFMRMTTFSMARCGSIEHNACC